MNNVYLSLGSNLGDRESHLQKAINLLEEKKGKLLLSSSIYETQPWQMSNAGSFLNQVILVKTGLSAAEVMVNILHIEESMGRIRSNKTGYESRIIDIDILFFNDDVIKHESLIVPHPQIENRRFVLEPLDEIASNYIHPGLKRTMNQLLANCPDKHLIAKFVSK